MKTIIKVIITTIVLLTLPISIYYGLRLKDTPFTYEYMNRSYVITLPNKVWFEINGSTDILKNDEILVNETPEVVEEGYDIGPQYPKYTTTYENDTIKKVQTSKRVGDILTIESYIEIAEGEHDEYIQKIFFSQYGTFENNTYTQEGCSVKISSKNGNISHDEEYALVMITYDIKENSRIEDILSFEISCL
ncbi:MAG: hypothetical protein WCY00_00305 [Candidatus Dojkabacteria bacterium]